MRIIKTENGFSIAGINDENKIPYNVEKGKNGKNYVTLDSVRLDVLNVSGGNSKTGEKVVNFNLPVELTCSHACECYRDGICYACSGCYLFGSNQKLYAENLQFFRNHTPEEFIAGIQLAIDTMGYTLFRWFTCGDIVNPVFLSCMVEVARNNPGVRFWSYTKKYSIVNRWIAENGQLPDNLVIIFSHWLNKDGTYYPMSNPYNLPTSEFIPFGREELKEQVTHVCPCSDPTVKATCATCDHPCYTLKNGESMALLEHSTAQTKERDKAIRQAKERL